MSAIVALIALSLIGIGETIYLIRKRIRTERPICVLGDSCSAVLESKYNKLFLIPNDILGLLTYGMIFLLSVFYLYGIIPTEFTVLGIIGLVSLGCSASLIFSYIEWRIIKAWCFWCLASTFTFFAIGIILILYGF
ncbi:MAG: vitamin K epoxide reductase family protein [Patescibacteria group bacterium]